MNRQEIIQLAESLGLLYPEPKSSSDYNHPAHMRLISKLEKFAMSVAWHERNKEFLNSENLEAIPKSNPNFEMN